VRPPYPKLGGNRYEDPAVLGRRFCTSCGRWRPLHDFHARKRVDGIAISWQANCSHCQRVKQRVSKGLRVRGVPYEARRPAMTHAEHLARDRELYAKRRLDPAWLKQHREYDRIYREAKRRAAGVPVREFKHRRSVIDRIERVFLPVEPLERLLDAWPGTETELCLAAGVSPRLLYRMRHESRVVRSDAADRLTMALGVPFVVVYGDVAPVPGHRSARSKAAA
jgi:hypothetical protein